MTSVINSYFMTTVIRTAAVLIASMVNVAFAAGLRETLDPAVVLQHMNATLCGLFERSYVTAACVIFDSPQYQWHFQARVTVESTSDRRAPARPQSRKVIDAALAGKRRSLDEQVLSLQSCVAKKKFDRFENN